VDVSLVRTAPGRLGTYWVEYGRPPRSIDVHYDRRDSTVCHAQREDAPWDALRSCRLFFVTGITAALSEQTRDLALEMAAAARAAGARVATDLNYRARLWTAAQAAPVLEGLARAADIVITTEDDLRTLFGWSGDPEAVAREALSRFRCRTVVLTRGAEGGLSFEDGRVRRCATFPSSPIDRVGAGDAFTAGYLYATLAGREEALEFGLAMAALKHSIPGDTMSTSLPELERILAREAHGIRR
jgi:2-dehydro-3-deoxygluconokinase